jgi:hypothetical protein
LNDFNLHHSENAERAFIGSARHFLSTEYLPKIERCLEQLNDDQIWWRANPESNSIGNLVLHLCGNARQWIIAGQIIYITKLLTASDLHFYDL